MTFEGAHEEARGEGGEEEEGEGEGEMLWHRLSRKAVRVAHTMKLSKGACAACVRACIIPSIHAFIILGFRSIPPLTSLTLTPTKPTTNVARLSS